MRGHELFGGSEEELALRSLAMDLAVRGNEQLADVITAADEIYRWLTRDRSVTSLTIGVGLPTEQTGEPTVAVTLTDTQEVVLTAKAADAAGLAVTDNQSWSVDNTAVVTLTVSDDTQTATAAATRPPTAGEATVTLTDGTITATTVVTVVAGSVQTLEIVEGTPTEQPPAV